MDLCSLIELGDWSLLMKIVSKFFLLLGCRLIGCPAMSIDQKGGHFKRIILMMKQLKLLLISFLKIFLFWDINLQILLSRWFVLVLPRGKTMLFECLGLSWQHAVGDDASQ